MKNIFLILPTQLFFKINELAEYDIIVLIEEPYYFNPKFHKQKLLLHFSTMYYYYDYLKQNKLNVKYVPLQDLNYSKILNKKNKITMYDPIDKDVIKKYNRRNVEFLDSKLFINSNADLLELKNETNRYTQSEFYKKQRIKHNILIDSKNNPIYGKWSFDDLNRNKFDNNYKEEEIKIYNNKYIEEARKLINEKYKNAFGNLNEKGSYYPCDHADSKLHLKYFIKNKIKLFGKYQDAISKNVIYGEHSNISAILNIGLLTPKVVITEIINYFNKSTNKKEIINSIEALIRQILGWREYMHFLYLLYGKDIFNDFGNKFKLNKTIPAGWYKIDGTDLEIINDMIYKVSNYAYLHHIERLMIMNNIMILCEFKLKEIYKWFTNCFIDSYDWVMIPNILMNINSINTSMIKGNNTNDTIKNNVKKGIKYMTKIYLSSDNYIKKMSDYKNKNDFEIINQLYWNFLKKYKTILKHDYSISRQLSRI